MSESAVEKLNVLMNEVKNEVQRAMQVMASKDEEIREHCFSLRTKVDAQSEVILEEVRQWSNQLRDQINQYEKQCLERFNVEEFQASASRLNSLVADINDCQSRVSEQINHLCLDAQKLNELIKETTEKLDKVKREKLRMRKQKFGNNMLDLFIKKGEKIDLDSVAMLRGSNILGLDQMQHLRSIRDLSDFEKLQHCFINPYANSFELIALVSNHKNKTILVKMDASGKILKVNDTKKELDVCKVQTVKGYFILQGSKTLAFDYNLNQKKIDLMNGDGDLFAANQQIVVCERTPEYDYRAEGPSEICFSLHGDCDYVIGEATYSAYAYEILASDKYLYTWYEDRVQVYRFNYIKKQQVEGKQEKDEGMSDSEESDEEDSEKEEESEEKMIEDEEIGQDEAKSKEIDEQEENVDNNDEEIHGNAIFMNDVKFDRKFKQVKLVGDKQIATFDSKTGTVCFYTQDEHVKFINECKASLDGCIKNYQMSEDCSSSFCFFNSQGDIYHNMF